MKKSKEYKISLVLSALALVLLGVALVTGLIGEIDSAIEKICFFLGFSLNCIGFLLLEKSRKHL